MLKVASVIAVMLLGMVAGCRSAPQPSLANDRAESAAITAPILATRQVHEDVRPIVFVQDEAEESIGSETRPELLPLVTPAERQAVSLSLADLEQMAFQNNPTLAVASARIDAARGRQFQAGRYPNPVVGYHATEIGNFGTAGQQGGFASQRFITGGKLKLDQAMAGKEIDEAHFRLHAQELRVLSDVRVRFYEMLAAQRRVNLTQELADIGDDLVKATQTLLKGRLRTENDLLQAEIRAEEARILLDNAHNANDESWRRLAAVIGLAELPMTPLTGELAADLPPLDWNESYAMVLSENPELAAAGARAERAGIAIARARKEPIPNVDLSVSVRHHNVIRSDVANVQVGIPIPVFDKNQGNIRSAEADWLAANNEVRRVELDLQDRLAVAYRRYANSRQQTDRYHQKMVPKAKESLELVRLGYETGQVTYLTLITAQQTYLQVSLAYLDALQALRASAAVIDGLRSRTGHTSVNLD